MPGLRVSERGDILSAMKLQEIEQQALELSEPERATLILSLIDTLGAPGTEVSDEEVCRRDAELATGAVQPMLHEEFVRQVREDRGRSKSRTG
jgi:hypothetical protein